MCFFYFFFFFFFLFCAPIFFFVCLFFFLMIRRPPRSTLFPYRRSSDLRPQPRRDRLAAPAGARPPLRRRDRQSTRLNSSHRCTSYAVFCLKNKKNLYPFFFFLKKKKKKKKTKKKNYNK